MDKELRILILEDVPDDAELEEHELRKAGLVFTSKIVATREAFLKELDEFLPDLILSDYALPFFDGLAALRIAKEKYPDVPFILVTGKLGEEFTIEKLKEGATDYVLKDNLKRIVPSVRRALEEAKLKTERKRAEEALRESEIRYKTLFSEALDGICLADPETEVIIDCNQALGALVGRDREELIGQHQSILHPPAGDKKGFSPTFEQHMADKHGQVLQTQVITKKGEIREVEIKANLLYLPEGKVLQGIFSDITERKSIEEELKRLATTDTLTGALNRTKFQETIEKEIEKVKRYNQPLSIMLFDIDHFKEVNDRSGHSAGDYVLKTIAGIVREHIRKIDYFVRWGGEEFIILSSGTQLDEAHALAERIRKVIENYKFENVGKVTVSFGVTEFKERDTEESFIKRADDAMYEAKKKGKNRVEVSI